MLILLAAVVVGVLAFIVYVESVCADLRSDAQDCRRAR